MPFILLFAAILAIAMSQPADSGGEHNDGSAS